MLSPDALLVMYYAGFGFVAVLGWTAIAQDLNEPFDDTRRGRWNRASIAIALIGVAHPALPLIARDIARQTARTDDDQRPASRYVTVANTCAVIATVGAAVVIGTTS